MLLPMAAIQILAFFLLNKFVLLISGASADFVEEVSCQSDSIAIILNKTDAGIRRWQSDSSAKPIAYVVGYKQNPHCGAKLKAANGALVLNFSIPYGPECGVPLSNLEPFYLSAETDIAVENDVDTSTTASTALVRVNHVFCLYTSVVDAIKVNDINTGQAVVASIGGKPKPKVQMVIRDPSGRNVKTAKFGDPLEFLLMLSADNAYKAINPKHCMFSDRDQMDERGARTLTFVQSNCPVDGVAELVQPVQDVRDDIFYTQFQAFRFGNQSTVYAHCKVDVCLTSDQCQSNCYKRLDLNNSIVSGRSRVRREFAAAESDSTQEASVSKQFAVLEDGEQQPLLNAYAHPSQPDAAGCLSSSSAAASSGALVLSIGVLATLLLVCSLLLCAAVCRLRGQSAKQRQLFEHKLPAFAINRAFGPVAASLPSPNPSHRSWLSSPGPSSSGHSIPRLHYLS